ncbi:MAG: amidase [Roseiflexaceae bacterium]
MDHEIIYASVNALARSIRNRSLSSEEVVAAYLRRIAIVNPQLNAVIQLTADTALEQARAADTALARGDISGPLHGVPMTLKDNLDTAGVISTGGTTGRAAYVPTRDATVVARLRAAGAILLGKTNTPELTLAFETDNLIHGRTSNPYDLQATSGGSSGGAAAIIAAGGSPFDIGSDTGGSIRLPAHFCGITGIKPTSGRVPRTGHILPPAGALDALTQLGPMARFVEDLSLILPIIAGTDWYDSTIAPVPLGDSSAISLTQLRVAIYTDNGVMTPTAETVNIVRAAADALANAGLSIVEARPPGIEQTDELYAGLAQADGGATTRLLLDRYGTTDIHPWLQPAPAAAGASPVLAATMAHWLFRWGIFRNEMLAFMEAYDVIVCPACAFPAIAHGTSDDADKYHGFSYTKTYNLAGWPGVVVRCGTSAAGLPIGVQIIARPWREDVALAVAAYLEQMFGGWQRASDE